MSPWYAAIALGVLLVAKPAYDFVRWTAWRVRCFALERRSYRRQHWQSSADFARAAATEAFQRGEEGIAVGLLKTARTYEELAK